MGGRRRQAWAMRTKVLPSTSSAYGTAKRRQIWRKISGVADDRSRHAGGDGDYRLVDGSARSSTGRPGRSGQGLAHAADKISWALPAIADAVPGKHQDLPCDADGHIRARLLKGLWIYGSGHLLSAFLRSCWRTYVYRLPGTTHCFAPEARQSPSRSGRLSSWYRWFESIPLQRRVRNEPSAASQGPPNAEWVRRPELCSSCRPAPAGRGPSGQGCGRAPRCNHFRLGVDGRPRSNSAASIWSTAASLMVMPRPQVARGLLAVHFGSPAARRGPDRYSSRCSGLRRRVTFGSSSRPSSWWQAATPCPVPSWSCAAAGSPIFCGRAASAGSTTTRSLSRTTPLMSNAAAPASAWASTTPASARI